MKIQKTKYLFKSIHSSSILLISILGVIGTSESAKAYKIIFEPDGEFNHIFGPPDGTGAIEYRNQPSKTTNIQIIDFPNFPIPEQRGGTVLNSDTSPIETIDGNPGVARVITDLSIGHGSSLGNLESDGSTPPPQSFTGPAGSLEQAFSASGFWKVIREPNDTLPLNFVSLNGSLRGDVRLDPPLFGNGSAFVEGSVKIEPFGSFEFATGKQTTSSGSLGVGIGIKNASGNINYTPPATIGQGTTGTIAFTGSKKDIELDKPYEFAMNGTLSSSLSSFGITGTAYSIANLWTQEFQLRAVPCRVQGGTNPNNIGDLQADISGACLDFGDAPDSYQTLSGSGGPKYEDGDSQRLGQLWDAELDGQPTPLADGDDRSAGCTPFLCLPPDDEDGVIFGEDWVDVTFNISRLGNNPYQLRAWWDKNENGVFDHTGELFIDDLQTLEPGIFSKRYELGFDPRNYYSRFRLTWDPLDPDVKPSGEYFSTPDCNSTNAAAGNCISHGEVEDYYRVPEPMTILGTGLALGFLPVLKKAQSKK